ncbi:MAG: hypothetical protein VW985_02665 [Gammaproteobacteria bacterium]
MTHPYPTHYEIKNPRHDEGDFALVLSQGFKVPAALADKLPPFPPQGVFDVHPLY